jgi:hypothetical protein
MADAPRRPRPTIRRRSKCRAAQRQDDPPSDPVDEALLETFPASDPPSPTEPVRRIGTPARPPTIRRRRE